MEWGTAHTPVREEHGAGLQLLGSRAGRGGGRWVRREAVEQSNGCLTSWQQETSGRTWDPGFRAGAGGRCKFSSKHETWDHGNQLCRPEQRVSPPPGPASWGALPPGQGPATRSPLQRACASLLWTRDYVSVPLLGLPKLAITGHCDSEGKQFLPSAIFFDRSPHSISLSVHLALFFYSR